ncbi:HAD family hydrolase [Flavobacterium sp. 17A]|uniref:HAD family hydrolase n=1 Tax=Flavobacterium potami TaxID=2872310 RepID=A0A9X1H840_9FLAO|nr:HAD hydrolase-like protein [Flavobacterium potami]MBZ4033808.1 HAD family hydrolase [Flavobacterium potami]
MELNNWTTNNLIETINKITAESTLFFDMDGTLINTNYSNFLSYKSAILSVTETEFNLTYNPNIRFNRSTLEQTCNLSEEDYYKIIKEKEECYINFLHETLLNQEVVDILYKYMKTNKTVLVSNCREERAIMTLNYHGLHDKFSNLFFRQLEQNNKKINKYEYAIKVLNISPNSVLIFENEISEIEDAIQAGINPYNVIKL